MAEAATPSNLWEVLIKHGPWAFWSGVLLAILWIVTLQPLTEERRLLLETFHQNAASSKSVAESTEAIKDSVHVQQETMRTMRSEIVKQTELRTTAMATMTAFADQMKSVMEEVKSSTITAQTRGMMEDFIKNMISVHEQHTETLAELLKLAREEADAAPPPP